MLPTEIGHHLLDMAGLETKKEKVTQPVRTGLTEAVARVVVSGVEQVKLLLEFSVIFRHHPYLLQHVKLVKVI